MRGGLYDTKRIPEIFDRRNCRRQRTFPLAGLQQLGTDNASPCGRDLSSSNVQGHSHSVTLQRSEVENPPGGGISRETSSNSGHSHTFAMTQAELQSVNGGTAVTVTDSSVQGHSHTYQIQKWF